jgi:hypothetical protein
LEQIRYQNDDPFYGDCNCYAWEFDDDFHEERVEWTENSTLEDIPLQEMYPLLILFVVAMYTFLVNASASPLKCNYAGNFTMYDNPSKTCFDKEWNSHLSTVVFFLILYGLGLPGVLIFLFWRTGTTFLPLILFLRLEVSPGRIVIRSSGGNLLKFSSALALLSSMHF